MIYELSKKNMKYLGKQLRGFRLPFPPVMASSYYGSIYPSVQNLLLAARSVGLGAALITLPLWSTHSVRRALGCPWSVTPCAVIPLGWPTGRYGPTTRRPVGEVVALPSPLVRQVRDRIDRAITRVVLHNVAKTGARVADDSHPQFLILGDGHVIGR